MSVTAIEDLIIITTVRMRTILYDEVARIRNEDLRTNLSIHFNAALDHLIAAEEKILKAQKEACENGTNHKS